MEILQRMKEDSNRGWWEMIGSKGGNKGRDWGTSIMLGVLGGHLDRMSTEGSKSGKPSASDSCSVPVGFGGSDRKKRKCLVTW